MQISRYEKKRHSVHPSPQFAITRFNSVMAHELDFNSPILASHLHTIIWIHDGFGDVFIDLKHFKIEKPILLYIKPWQALRLNITGPADGVLIAFESKFLDLFDKSSFSINGHGVLDPGRITPPITIEDQLKGFLQNIANQMLEEYTSRHLLYEQLLSNLLKVFIICLDRRCGNIEPPITPAGRPSLAKHFFTLVENNYKQKRKVSEYADLLNVSSSYLNKIISAMTGCSPRHHIQQRIILEAKRRLIFEDNSLKEIAYLLGFCDPAHFSKYFKSITGSNFRNFKSRLSVHF